MAQVTISIRGRQYQIACDDASASGSRGLQWLGKAGWAAAGAMAVALAIATWLRPVAVTDVDTLTDGMAVTAVGE